MKFYNLFKHKCDLVNNLVFIFGCPRSGTTFLWSLLESHESTIPFLLDFNKINGKYLTSESGVYIKDSQNAKKKIESFAQQYSNKLVIEKTPLHTIKHEKIIEDFPRAKILVIYRNPIAIVNSMILSDMEAFKSYNLDKSIDEVRKYYKHLINLHNSNDTFSVKYEALISNTTFELSKIFDFLNLSDTNINEIIEICKGKSKVNVKGALRKGQPYSYLNELNTKKIAKIKIQLKNELIFYNTLGK